MLGLENTANFGALLSIGANFGGTKNLFNPKEQGLQVTLTEWHKICQR